MGESTERDRRLMRRALALAEHGLYSTHPNPRVGAVVSIGERIVGEGFHQRAGEPHAEILALASAGNDARGATVYVTLEPCCHHGRTGPCTDALIHAGVARVVAAMGDPDPRVQGNGFSALREAGITVECGVLQEQARQLNVGYLSRIERGRPFLRAKLAMSLDGRTALANGRSQWITAADARRDVQHFRARSDVILTGVGTIIHDDPQLNVRPQAFTHLHDDARGADSPLRQPVRVIFDSTLRTPLQAHIFATGPVWIATTSSDTGDYPVATQIIRAGAPGTRVCLQSVMTRLGQEGFNEAWLECGPELAGSFIAQQLVDELVIYCAPTVLGPDAKALLQLPRLSELAEAPRFEFIDIQRIGRDLRIIATPSNR